ncbi:peptide/nickel transport system ATP-binding protein [Maritalea mobilis]|uniref:Peptide/nickel transport system ATP-binding protein n=1 Tax=Maritalea mobilis TaxID=483324 RepID=A0A4R6VWK6_9HYPH|nr:ABC transporter ATP-binding protein [Maritalea mobilis]TDQ67207.1 peptide/nickel transport system ATP-binding protein [Maritalea mobilis]
MTQSERFLDVKDLKVDYMTLDGPFRAVKGVDLHINRGEVLGLAGESGCGKSTIAYALMRLHRPPAFIAGGDITVDGEDVLAFDEETLAQWRWSKVSLVFQSAMNALNPVLTIFEQFRDVYHRHTGKSTEEARARAVELMELVGIDPVRLDDYPHQLSGGMRQRVVLANALILEPQMIIMDEPTTALDVVVQREILQEIAGLQKKFGFSILFITHDLALMSQFADRIAIMLKGEIVEVNSAHEILHNPQHDYTKQLWDAMPSFEDAEGVA